MLERGFEAAKTHEKNLGADQQFAIEQAQRVLREAGVVDPRLDAQMPQGGKSEDLPKPDLRQQTYELLSQVREPSAQEKEALEKIGFVFLPVLSKSYSQVVSEKPDHFWEDELEYANSRPELRDYVPPVILVALNPTRLALPDSFNKSKGRQLEMIAKYSRDEIETKFPGAKAVMLPATGYAQADIAYQGTTGQVLFKNFFARALDQTSEVHSADVGRFRPDLRLRVHDLDADNGYGLVGAVPAVVFLRK